MFGVRLPGDSRMIVAKHPDGRIVLLAKEHGLQPLLKTDGVWGPALISGEELNDFLSVRNENERAQILSDALLNRSVT